MNLNGTSKQMYRRRLLATSLLMALLALFAFTQTLKADDGGNEPPNPPILTNERQAKEGGGEADIQGSTFTVDKTEAEREEILEYTVVISNSGNNFSVVTIEDVLPSSLNYVANSLNSSTTPISSGDENGVITWTAAINNGAMITVSFQAEIDVTVPYSSVITNTVTLTGTNLATTTMPITLQTTTVVISPTAAPTGMIAYLPILAKPLPTPSSLALAVAPNANNEFTLSWAVSNIADVTGFELQHANSPDFANATIQTLGTSTQSMQNPTPSPRSLNYYRVRAVVGNRVSDWSNELLVIGAYDDQFSDSSTGWTMRRQDTDDTDNQNYYRDGHYVLEMDSRWDYQIAAPLLPVPDGDYVIESSAKMVGVDNLHTFGFIFGSDWNGQPCPATDYSSCFNEYYRLLFTWRGSNSPLKMQLKRITQHSPTDNTGQGTDLISFNDVNVNSPAEGYHVWRIEVSGGNIKVFVDNNLIGEATDPNPFVGRYFGVIAAVDEYTGLEAEYDWFKVRPK